MTINSSIVGNITLEFSLSSTNSGEDSIFENGSFEVKPFAALSVTGPQDNRLSVIPGTNSTLTLNLTNLGTRDLRNHSLNYWTPIRHQRSFRIRNYYPQFERISRCRLGHFSSLWNGTNGNKLRNRLFE